MSDNTYVDKTAIVDDGASIGLRTKFGISAMYALVQSLVRTACWDKMFTWATM